MSDSPWSALDQRPDPPLSPPPYGLSSDGARDEERDRIIAFLEGPHEVMVSEATIRWLVIQLRLNKHRA